MKIYVNAKGVVVEHENSFYTSSSETFDSLVARDDLYAYLQSAIGKWTATDEKSVSDPLAPLGTQEVWAAGVTYYRSRNARMAESSDGGSFYDRVYDADRPELFFKATPNRVVGPNGKVAIRDDSRWSVPEPEVALLVTPNGKVVGYTVANDMSSRDIEGENPLYLPQAKVYDRCCSLGPAVLVSPTEMDLTTEIRMEIIRAKKTEFSGTTTLASRKRTAESLVGYLFRQNSFPKGCYLLTGTGIVPPDSFTLQKDDEIRISIEGIGTLVNSVG